MGCRCLARVHGGCRRRDMGMVGGPMTTATIDRGDRVCVAYRVPRGASRYGTVANFESNGRLVVSLDSYDGRPHIVRCAVSAVEVR